MIDKGIKKDFIDMTAIQIISQLAPLLWQSADYGSAPLSSNNRRAVDYAYELAFTLWDKRESILSKES